MTTISQRSLAGGEITPALYARVDQVKYATGVKTCRNFIVLRHGGVANRPGGGFVCEVENSAELVKLIEFVFNTEQTYILLFGALTMRVIKNGELLRLAADTITGTSKTNPVVVTAANSYSAGDEVFISGVVGMTELNERSFLVKNPTGADFELQTKDGVDLDGTAFTTYVSDGTSEKVFELETPYVEADLAELHHAQSADVVTICHPNYEPRELTRTGDTAWALATITAAPATVHPAGAGAVVGAGGTKETKYKVTAIDDETGVESLPGVEAAVVITGASQANPVVITAAGHGYTNGDTVLITGVLGMTELNGRRYTVANQAAGTFELLEVDGTAYTLYASGGEAFVEDLRVPNGDAPTFASPNVISWTKVPGASKYNIYRATENTYGFIGVSDSTTYNDSSAVGDEDTDDTPPADRNPFLFAGNYPSTVTFHQQRRVFANTDNAIEDVWASKTNDFYNFSRRTPTQDSDTVNWNLAGRKVNEVQSMIDLNGTLIIMTKAGEWSIGGNSSGVLTANGGINPRQYSFNGSSKVLPVTVNTTAIYIQDRQSKVRDLSAEADFASFGGDDLTTFSTHLFEDHTLVDMAYQQIPHSVIWIVRSDGTLLGLTHLREQEILAWHRHDFENGFVENVVTVPEGTEDAVYVVVRRTIDGKTVRYVERLKSRKVVDVEDYVFLDSSVTVDGTNTTATTMTLSGGSTWAYDEDLTLTSSVAHFASTDVGALEIHLKDADGVLIRLEVTVFISPTVVTVRPHKTVPVSLQGVARTTWGDATGTVTCHHLEGQKIGAFCDGFVEASPHNPSHTEVTVTDGIATLDRKYVVKHVGLPITADLETLDIDSVQAETIADKKALTNEVTLTVEDTRGLWAGTQTPVDDDIDTDLMSEFQLRSEETQEQPVDLKTENISTELFSEWTQGGRIFIRQVDAVPASIEAIHAGGFYPFRGV